MEPHSSHEPPNRPLRLLSLDGGGIRGISELVILQEIMHRLERVLQKERLPPGTAVKEATPLLPADYFDMICGTSTGGLIAILLGRLRLSVPEAIDKYRLLAKQVFSERKYRVQDGTFKASKLEAAIKETIEWKLGKGNAETRMFMTDTVSCKTFVCAVPARHIDKQPRLFRTWSADKSPGYDCAIWEAARATSAAPIFFKRILIGDAGLEEEFVDAGLGCNNPVRHLVKEATNEFGPERMVNCIVSIGTGKPMVANLKAPSIFQRVLPLELVKVLASIATDTEDEASKMKSQFQNCPGLYHRLNVEQGLQGISLEEWDKLGEIKSHTMAYLRDDTISQEIDVIVDALAGKSSEGFPIGQLNGVVATPVNTNSHFLYPSHQVAHYVIRTDFVETIQNSFQNRRHKSAPNIAVLYGMGGCGKTQVALEYCRRGQNEKWFSGIFWFDASSPASMAQSFANAADELSKPNFDMADAKGNIRFVLNAIETRNIYWLLVFDNFDDPSAFGDESIKEYFPRGSHASILFTSRHEGVKEMGLCIDVTSMLDMEALHLLLARSHVERSDANIQEGENIVKRLGYHALAIDQAGAYIAARCLDLDLYMPHYYEREEKVLSEIPELWDYQRKIKTDTNSEAMIKLTVFTTWELSVQLITGTPAEQNDKIHLLTLAAFLNSKEVSDDLFTCYGSENIGWLVSCVTDGVWDKYEVQGILKELRKLSLVYHLNTGRNGSTFSLHPLIQDWVTLRVKSDTRQAFAEEAVLLLSVFLENNHDNMTLSQKQALLSHIEVVLQNENKYGIFQGNSKELQLAASYFATFFHSQGRHSLDEQMTQYVLQWRKMFLGNEHPDTLRSMSNLGVVLTSQGKYSKAAQIHQQTFKLREKVLGKEHPDTLQSMNNLGLDLERQGKYNEANQIHQQTLQLQEKVLGKDHPNTLQSMNNLGLVLHKQGKYREAEQIYQQTIQIQVKVLCKEHPDILQSMNNLGLVLQQQGKYNEAKQIFQQILQIQEKVLCKEHPKTLQSMNNLGLVLQKQGKYNEAKQIHQHTLQIRVKVLGKEHPNTLQSMNNLGIVLGLQGKNNEAEQILQDMIQLQEKVLSKDNPDILQSMNNLGVVLHNHGKYDEAEKIYQQTLQLQEKVLGKEHPNTLRCIYNLGTVLEKQGKYDEAKPIYQRAFQLGEKVLGREHPDTIVYMHNFERLRDATRSPMIV